MLAQAKKNIITATGNNTSIVQKSGCIAIGRRANHTIHKNGKKPNLKLLNFF
jgi:hypothetical protein